MKRPSVDPSFTFALSLVLSLLLCYPTFKNMLHGSVDVTDGRHSLPRRARDLVVRRARRREPGRGVRGATAPANAASRARASQPARRRDDLDDSNSQAA